MSSWTREPGRDVVGEIHIFVLRFSLHRAESVSPTVHVTIQAVDSGETKQFGEVGPALDHLRGWLLHLAEPRPDLPGGPDTAQ